MKKYLFIFLMLLIIMPAIMAATQEQAELAADQFVKKHGKFYHQYSFDNDVKLFRKLYSETSEELSFLYKVITTTNNQQLAATFIVSVDKSTLSITKVIVEKKNTEKFSPLL